MARALISFFGLNRPDFGLILACGFDFWFELAWVVEKEADRTPWPVRRNQGRIAGVRDHGVRRAMTGGRFGSNVKIVGVASCEEVEN
jgi:hypothetical protein